MSHSMHLPCAGVVELASSLGNVIGVNIGPEFIFDYPTVHEITENLWQITSTDNMSQIKLEFRSQQGSVGMDETCTAKIIGSKSRWPTCTNGDSRTPVPHDRWDQHRALIYGNESSVKISFGGFLLHWKEFDSVLFQTSHGEAAQLDPQQRCLLEDSLDVLQGGPIPWDMSIFVGIGRLEDPRYVSQHTTSAIAAGAAGLSTAKAASAAAGRLSYTFNIHGSCVAIDTACSSTVVCMKMILDEFRLQQSENGLICGANLPMSQETSLMFSASGMLAPDGRCKALDITADGYGRSEAVSVLRVTMSKHFYHENDPECIGCLLSCATNQDGRSSSLTAPNGPSQQQVIRKSLSQAQLGSSSISLHGLHGTGTALGDPVEISALQNVVREYTGNQVALIASKSSYGHAETVSGLCTLLHVSSNMLKGSIPSITHLRNPNRHMLNILDDSVFSILPRENSMLTRQAPNLIGGFSAFAFQGTNAHAVVAAGNPLQRERPTVEHLLHRTHAYIVPNLHVFSSGFFSNLSSLTIEFMVGSKVRYLLDHKIQHQGILPAATSLDLLSHIPRTMFERQIKHGNKHWPTVAVQRVILVSPLLLGPSMEFAGSIKVSASMLMHDITLHADGRMFVKAQISRYEIIYHPCYACSI